MDILDADGVFTEVDYEGFYLEFSLDLIRDSLLNFSHNFAARPINSWFSYIQTISTALEQAREVLQYDHYLKKSTTATGSHLPAIKKRPSPFTYQPRRPCDNGRKI